MEDKYLIYQIYNKIEDKSYIGSTHRFITRINEHKYGKKEWQVDFATHPENWEVHILQDNIEGDKIGSYEKYYIDLYDSINNGYNKRRQGNGIIIEVREKMSESRKGKIPWNKGKTGVYSEESLKKMSESTKGNYVGEKNPMFGKKHSEETKKKISETKKKNYQKKHEEKCLMQ